ncbi:MAG: hypothetical protein AAFQ10_03450 [Pseudomonadota bacterium]
MAEQEREAREGHKYVDFDSPAAYEQAKKLVLTNGTALNDHVLAEPENTPEGKFTVEMAQADADAFQSIFAAGPEGILAKLKADALSNLVREADALVAPLMGKYTRLESKSHDKQRQQALLVKDGVTGEEVALLRMLAGSDEAMEAYADDVLAMAAWEDEVTVKLVEFRRQAKAAIDAAESADVLTATIEQLKQQAAAAAADMQAKRPA